MSSQRTPYLGVDVLDAMSWLNSDIERAEYLGVTYRTVMRWRNEGGTLPAFRADEYAVKIGCHPNELWSFV